MLLVVAALVADVAGGDRSPAEEYRTTSLLAESLKLREQGATYDTYVKLQQSKLDEHHSKAKVIDQGRQAQLRRELETALAAQTAGLTTLEGKTVICLGARLGGEVRAFKSLGAIALGIDLNPVRGKIAKIRL